VAREARRRGPSTAFGGPPPLKIEGRILELLEKADAAPLVAEMPVKGVGRGSAVVAGDFD
jgi:hypothetical protein